MSKNRKPCRVALRIFLAVLMAFAVSGVLSSNFRAYADDAERKVKTKVSPMYPELAKKMAIVGAVKVEMVIDAGGTVKSAKAVGGHPLLIPAAVDAAKKWRYEPGSSETTTIVEFKFSQ